MFRSTLLATACASAASAYFITDVKQFMEKNIDPIVLPGTYNSHMHSFFGSDAVTKDLPTSAELQAGCSTADNPNDFSVYWVPTLYHVTSDGSRTAIPPKRFVAYYNFEKTETDTVIPQDFSVVAGNAGATSVDDVVSGSDLTWLCEKEDFDADGKEHSQYPLSTCSGGVLQAVLWFQDCVNPETLESAYSSGGSCPDGMFTMPQLRFSIRYDVSDIGEWEGEPPLELACGPSYCFHGDFINGWLEEYGEVMRAGLTKERSVQKLEGYRAGSACDRDAVDADPENGTDDYDESLEMMNGEAPVVPEPVTETEPEPVPEAEPTTSLPEVPTPIVSETPETTEVVPTPPATSAPPSTPTQPTECRRRRRRSNTKRGHFRR